MSDQDELLELEKLLREIKSGNCPYYNPSNPDESCGPFSGACSSGVDENGEVYCDRIKRRYLELMYEEGSS